MYKIQNVCFDECIEVDGTKDLYYRSNALVYRVEDGAALLKKKNTYDFFTYFNALSLNKWKTYTLAKSFSLVVNARGKFEIVLFGHGKEKNQLQKEWIGRFQFSSDTYKEFIIPIPMGLRSPVVSFSLTTMKDTYITDAFYAAEVSEEMIKTPSLAILSYTAENREDTNRIIQLNYERIKNELFTCQDSAKKYQWCIEGDTEFISDFCEQDKAITVINRAGKNSFNQDLLKEVSLVQKPTHILLADNNDIINAEAIRRVYALFGIIKERYENSIIVGGIRSKERPNYLYTDTAERNENKAKTKLDVNLWFNVVEGDRVSVFEQAQIPPIGFVCSSADVMKKHGEIGELLCAKQQTGNLLSNSMISMLGIDVERAEDYIVNNAISEELSRITLQRIIFGEQNQIDVTRHMYCRSDINILRDEDGNIRLPGGNYYDFFTYFNAVSMAKWQKYTNIEEIQLVLEITGDFDIELFGHFKNNTGYQKEWLGRHSYSLPYYREIHLPYFKGCQSSVVAFGIMARSEVVISKAYYSATIKKENLRDPLIAMVTTTFRKEEYVRKNIELLNAGLFSDTDFSNHFCWNIIDNGRTLCNKKTKINEWVTIFPNKNVGGAGGFSRGMIESLKQENTPTHILLMDDDVVFSPESFKRLCVLLASVKDEYKEYFVSGAMLKMGQPNIQHEDTGRLISKGYHEAAKPNLDLNLWNNVLENEIITSEADHPYAAWWFCCIPVGIARLDNLPVPVFVRGDDVEYSLRNKAEFITMNGLCIWHEGFEGKFSAALEYYQVNRNELAVRAMHPELHDVDCIGHIKMIFWEEMYKFNYKGASLLLDAVEDYMKGPEFFKKLDGEKSMKDHRALDNTLSPITDEIRAQINYETLYQYETVTGMRKKIYDYSYNGQARVPGFMYRNKTGVIPYGWGYFPGKQCLVDTIIAVNPPGDNYVIYKRDRRQFKDLKKRFLTIISQYEQRHKEIENDYQKAFGELTSVSFWNNYLGDNDYDR